MRGKIFSLWSAPGLSRPTFDEATSQQFQPTQVGRSFGPGWSTHWFKVQVRVPDGFLNEEIIELHWEASNEGMIWTEDGHPLQGLSGDGERVEWIIPPRFRDGKEHTFYLEMACNGMFGLGKGARNQPPDPDRYFTLEKAEIVAVNQEARALYFDFSVISEAARQFPEHSWESHKALQVANTIIDVFTAGEGSDASIREARQISHEYLGEKADRAEVYESHTEPIVYAIGHCHIDTCWLWPWEETKRKVARSWSNQCDLIDRYPEHRFTASSAQQFKWLKQYYPSVYARVMEKIKQGSFQPIGGSWVEHDTNMPSGESLIRQFLYGQRFFQREFGKRSQTFWLPDTFGYTGQLPQICRLAGMHRFVTQKLSWNNINNFPHTTFNWVALDGSQVLCHMPPSETYNADAQFCELVNSIDQHKSLDQDASSLLIFGKGDGGGGPTFQQIETLRRFRGLSDRVGLLPRVHQGKSVDEFFEALERKAATGTEFVTWYGELYFELHRGTYTTQAKTKWNNRKAEIMLHDLEYLATLASIKNSGYQYPKTDIDEIWEGILLCQFHDCLPGSCIRMCYDDSDKLYADAFASGERLLRGALSALGFVHEASPDQGRIALNTLPWPRKELVQLPSSQYAVIKGGIGVASVENLPATPTEPVVCVAEVRNNVFELSNRHYKLEVENGSIISLVDLSNNRQVLSHGGKANQFVIFDDKPLYRQAWDVEVYHLNSRKELQGGSSAIAERGPYRASIVTKTIISERSWLKSTISLHAAIDDEPSRIEIDTEVEWHEDMKFLKVEFDVDVMNTEASYETQYGIVKRPTHYNTQWDMAKFEVCCHKWADLSENGYGVSILNDSKYGFSTCGHLMRLSLLRSPKAPDASADMGHHRIRYAIFPHRGPLDFRTVRAGYNFNNPMHLILGPGPASLDDITLTGNESLILDAVKRGEDDEDVSLADSERRKGQSIILRVFESLGGHASGTIKTTLPVVNVWKCNILEDDEEPLEIQDGNISIALRAFEVATFRLQL
ncbi:hypothetical protein CNMCM8927_000730 [Aspergillus lentulus]|uniref:Alpha-mannosidase n=1 Tax=Aspergillus lentulus TaxID=293939 RepID=A0AAN5YJY2_ASPLE|nr:hypothetical protein CNMCM8060_006279 [Aspergillus lentulus]KAF4176563.1 hypothetical protein CNMCM8060_006286 [Aspergillus lentulus]KAF4180430.1 hypothetical protein CNMCM7927_001188 [Aspergillus lentulus]KAF4192941.1 hypothetical protein CNMCM8694_009507 [Aspergillus lentulus]KAF4202025.1 hypothetical protein CNMCM8927_000730 [Aspergillus lentulus]